MIYWELFVSFFQIGLFSFGGGYAAIPLLQQQTVTIRGWLTMEAFADLVILSEMTPGPIALNSATFVGQQMAGLPGAIVATLSIILPSCIIVSGLAYLYKRFHTMRLMQNIIAGIRPAVVAMIASAGIGIFITAVWPNGITTAWLADMDLLALGIFIVSLVILRVWKWNPILIIVASGAVGLIVYLLTGIAA